VKLLLTSGGVSNATIENALVGLLGKPIAESNALCVPAAAYGSLDPVGMAYRFITGATPTSRLANLGWKSLGVLELTALPTMKEAIWAPKVRETDALLVWGGDVMYLCYWMRESGLADLLPSLPDTVWVGVSSGSMVLTPDFGEPYDDWFCREPTTVPESDLPAADARALGLVDFSVFPHVDNPRAPENSMANAERWASGRSAPTYAIDDATAIQVVDGTVAVVSEGHWKLLTP